MHIAVGMRVESCGDEREPEQGPRVIVVLNEMPTSGFCCSLGVRGGKAKQTFLLTATRGMEEKELAQ